MGGFNAGDSPLYGNTAKSLLAHKSVSPPAFTPLSPPMIPISPPYCPVSPPYFPVSPPYCPVSPTYYPVLPPMNPSSPPARPFYPCGRPSYPRLSTSKSTKSYADIVKQPKSAAVLVTNAGITKYDSSSPIRRSGIKVFTKPSHAKNIAKLEQAVSAEGATKKKNTSSNGNMGKRTPGGLKFIDNEKFYEDMAELVKKHKESSLPKLVSSVSSSEPVVAVKKEPSNVNATPSRSSSGYSSSSGIRLKINFTPNSERITVVKPSQVSIIQINGRTTRKRAAASAPDDEDDTDSDMDIGPSVPRQKISNTAGDKKTAKKQKIKHEETDSEDDNVESGTKGTATSACNVDLTLMQPVLKRKSRIVDPSNPDDAQLISVASKAGSDIYDSDAEDLPGDVVGTTKPDLFRNVRWGVAAKISEHGNYPESPEFTQFVPGRWERQPDGTLLDQKHKLIVKLIDKRGNKRVFTNPPPRDWQSQEAITTLNKRTVQQIRRNTSVRFREVVTAYAQQERRWILAKLRGGKPTQGWKKFVDEFNKAFQGKTLAGTAGPRPARSHSSLTKEVERFGPSHYRLGLVPVPSKAE